MPRILPFLEEAIEANKELKTSGILEAKALTWGQDLKDLDSNPDLIIVSDCIYYEASVEPLIQTLKALKQKNPKVDILLSYEVRDYLESKRKIAQAFFRAASSADFQIRPFPTEACHAEYASDDIRVLQLQ